MLEPATAIILLLIFSFFLWGDNIANDNIPDPDLENV